jgi:hypothetical protein
MTRITAVDDAAFPLSPDGLDAYFAYRDGGYDLWSIAADGTKERRLTTEIRRREPACRTQSVARVLVRSQAPSRWQLQHLDRRAAGRCAR